jgi:integrase
MLHLAFAAGMRVSELVSVRLDQIDCQGLSSVHIIGKGRRERVLPLWKETAAAVSAWPRIRSSSGDPALFLNAKAQAMTRSGFEYLLAKHVATAAGRLPSLASKRVTPHVLRHYVPSRTMSRTFCFKAVFCRKSPFRRDIVRPLRQGLIPERTCSNTDLSDLAPVRAQQRRRKAPPVESWHI